MFKIGDIVTTKGSTAGYVKGKITGWNGHEYRVFWFSGSDMYHEFVPEEMLVLVE